MSIKKVKKETKKNMNNKITFEDFLQEKHSEQYCGTDDYMSNDYVDWLDNLDNKEIIDYTEELLRIQKEEISKIIQKSYNQIWDKYQSKFHGSYDDSGALHNRKIALDDLKNKIEKIELKI